MDFNGDRVEKTISLHYWENIGLELRLNLCTFFFYMLFLLIAVIYTESKFDYKLELDRIFLFVCISCFVFFQIRWSNTDTQSNFWEYHRSHAHTNSERKADTNSLIIRRNSKLIGNPTVENISFPCTSSQFSHKNLSWLGTLPCVCEQVRASACVLQVL